MRTKSLLRTLAAALVLWLVVPGFLAGCGGGGPHEPQYALTIDEPLSLTTALSEVCSAARVSCRRSPPAPTAAASACCLRRSSASWGPTRWSGATTANGASGTLRLIVDLQLRRWRAAWFDSVPLVLGDNRITVTMTAGGYTQSASVTITRT